MDNSSSKVVDGSQTQCESYDSNICWSVQTSLVLRATQFLALGGEWGLLSFKEAQVQIEKGICKSKSYKQYNFSHIQSHIQVIPLYQK